jgi:hypothetical protein
MAPWLETLKTIAPTIATALGGPLAGLAVSIVGKALGADNATQDTIAAVVTGAKPEDLQKLKQAEEDFQLSLKKLDVDLAELDTRDRSSARALWGSGKPTIATLSFVIIGAFIAMVWHMVYNHGAITPGNEALVGTLIGYVSAKADQVVAYFFGSSHGSTQKNDMLADAFKKNGN